MWPGGLGRISSGGMKVERDAGDSPFLFFLVCPFSELGTMASLTTPPLPLHSYCGHPRLLSLAPVEQTSNRVPCLSGPP